MDFRNRGGRRAHQTVDNGVFRVLRRWVIADGIHGLFGSYCCGVLEEDRRVVFVRADRSRKSWSTMIREALLGHCMCVSEHESPKKKTGAARLDV
jgi:hypothetical protein